MQRLEKPVFLTGTIKSGTTLLARCLGAHPLIHYVGHELSEEWTTFGVPMAVVGNPDPECPRLSAHDVTPTMRSALHARFLELHGAGQGEVFLNKNPHLWNKLPLVRELFPDASVVVTGRDLRSTVASVKAHAAMMHREHGIERFLPHATDACWTSSPPMEPGLTEPSRTFPGGDVRVLADYWLRTYTLIDSDLEGFERVCRVRHRDLVVDPHTELARITAALDIDHRDVELPDTIDATRNARWKDILTQDEQASLEDWIAEHRESIARLISADTTL